MTQEKQTSTEAGKASGNKEGISGAKIFFLFAGLWFLNAFIAYAFNDMNGGHYNMEGLEFAAFMITMPMFFCGLFAFAMIKLLINVLKKHVSLKK